MHCYKIIPDTKLPYGARLEAQQRNNFRGEIFAKKSTANIARELLQEPEHYVVVRCSPTDGVML